MRFIFRAVVFLLVSCLSLPLFAQSASVSGKVSDSQGSALSGSNITLLNTDTRVKRTTLSGADGNFILPPVSPGHYQVKAEATGFAPSVVTGITLEVGQSKEVNLTLAVGTVSQSVSVTDVPPEVSTQDSDRSTVTESALVANIPLDVRNPLQLTNMTAGVTQSDSQTAGTNFSSQSTTNTFRINGAKSGETDILIDGATDTVFYDTHAAGGIPGLDAVQEFRVYTTAYSPEFGHISGGIVSYALRSGTNELHGQAWEYFRDAALDANGYNANAAGQAKPPFTRNQFGFRVGGPVLLPKIYDGRGRTFFFGTYEGLRDNYVTAGGFEGTVPTALERKGDFSQTKNANGSQLAIYDPSTITLQRPGSTVCTSTPVTTSQTVYCRSQFSHNGAQNVIDPTRINPVGLALLNLYPLPNQPGVGGSDENNYFSNATSSDIDHSFDIRIDHRISDKHSIFGHVDDFQNYINYPDVYRNQQTPNNANNHIPGYNFEVGHTWVISPSVIFEHHISWAHMESTRTAAKPLGTAMFGFPASSAPGLTATFTPQVQPVANQLSEIGNSEPYERNPNSVWQYAADATWLRGIHTLKIGLDLRRYPGQLWDPQLMTVAPSKSFTGGPNASSPLGTSGNAIAELLLGQAVVTSGYAPKVNFAHQYYAVYAEDTAKLTPKLVLTYGLRYSYEGADVAVNNELSFLDTTSPSPIAAQVPSIPHLVGGVGIPGQNGLSRSLQVPGKAHFDPRLGVSYSLNSKTVLHAGVGIFYHPAASWNTNPPSYGFTRKTASIDAEPDGVTPLYNLSNPFPSGLPTPYGNSAGLGIELGQTISGNLRKQSIPYQESWSLDVQRSLPQHFVVTMAYAGSTGVRLLGSPQLNQLSAANLALGSAINKVVPNPFSGVITDSSSILSKSTVQDGYLLRAFPQFQNFEAFNQGFGHSNYQAAQLTVEHRLSQGISLLMGYTYSKAIDDIGESGSSATIQDNGCHGCERSVSDQNQTHVFRLSMLYELPFGPQKTFLHSGFLSYLAGGWELGTIYQYNTGQPIGLTSPIQSSSLNGGANTTTTIGSSTATQTETNQMRPTLVPGVNYKQKVINPATGQRSFFNPAAFVETGTYAFGDAPRFLSGVNLPSFLELDALLQKKTQITERLSATFRIEMLNATNNVVFAGPATDVSTASTFGYAPHNQSNNPREIQLSGRFSF
jgi:Carboxypeptidase regulatory-like domain/TonB dependent receptor